MIKIPTFILLLLLSSVVLKVEGQNSLLLRSTLSLNGSSKNINSNNNNYLIQQSIGQSSVIGLFTNNNNEVLQGFLTPNLLNIGTSLNIQENQFEKNMVLYPNPFIDSFTLNFDNVYDENINITIYDLLGRTVFVKQYPFSNKILISPKILPAGSYLLKISIGEKQFSKIIIKK